MPSMMRAFLVCAAAGFIVACGPQNPSGTQKNAASGGQSMMGEGNGMRGHGGGHGRGLRRICADEIQKYCADDQRKRRCLKNNFDKLGESCKAAVNAPRDRGGDQTGSQPTNGTQPQTGTQPQGSNPQPSANQPDNGDD